MSTPYRIDHFTIQGILGAGGMGIVYLAHDERLGRKVALKVLSEYDLPNAERRALFFREARAAAAIRHTNVATIYEIGDRGDAPPYIAMEYSEGQTLSRLVRERPLDGVTFVRVARQIAEGVAAAHRNGVIHRDLKSANVMVEADGTVKILDFGLAKVQYDYGTPDDPTLSSSSSFFGTVPYISPEQARGLPMDARSDLFSLGVVLYEAASGRLPFVGEGPLTLLQRIQHSEPETFVPGDATFPAGAAAIISKLLQKDPDDRYQTADQLVRDLTLLERDLEVTARHLMQSLGGKSGGLERTMRRKRSVAWGGAIVLATILLIGGALYINRERTAPPTTVATPVRSIAVLPFRNLSGTTHDEFLSIGLADALATRLQQVPDLAVRPTSAVMPYQHRSIQPVETGRELGVDGILEGHFVVSGDRVRVNLQLTDVRTGYGIWARTVDGSRGNLIALMDEVSTGAASAIQPESGIPRDTGRSEPRTRDPRAYEEYLRARALVGTLVPEQHAQQVSSLKRAIELDPTFAAAYAEMALALSLGQIRGMNQDATTRNTAEWYARQAVRLDPNLPEAHLALGRTLVRFPDRYRESVRENLAALRLNQNDPQALYTLTTYFISTGELQKAACAGEHFVRVNPVSNDAKTRGYWNVNSVDPEGAIRLAELALTSPDTALAGHDIRALSFLLLGNVDAAEAEEKKASALVPNHYIGKSLRAMIAASRGDRPSMERALDSMRRDAETNHWAALRAALAYARTGDREQAMSWISKAAELGNHSWYFLVKHPWFVPMQQEPEFQNVLARMKDDLDDVRDDVVGVYTLICG